MKLTPRIQKAITAATVLHRKQIRKDYDIPYIMHPFSVFLILTEYTDDEDILTASLMHDTLEDVRGYESKELKRDFGEKVCQMVEEVSEEKTTFFSRKKERLTWYSRKQKYIDGLKTASEGALLIAAADKIHNMCSMLESYKKLGSGLWKHFNAPSPKDDYVWFYDSILTIFKERLHNKIVKDYEITFLECKHHFQGFTGTSYDRR